VFWAWKKRSEPKAPVGPAEAAAMPLSNLDARSEEAPVASYPLSLERTT
jgi:hypothetical protein